MKRNLAAVLVIAAIIAGGLAGWGTAAVNRLSHRTRPLASSSLSPTSQPTSSPSPMGQPTSSPSPMSQPTSSPTPASDPTEPSFGVPSASPTGGLSLAGWAEHPWAANICTLLTDAEVLSALNGQQILSHDALPLLDAVETPPSSGPGSHPSNEGHCAWSVQVPGYVRGDVSIVVVNRIDPVVAQSAMVEERGQGGYTSLSIGAEAFQQDGMTRSVYFRVGSYLVIVTAENETSDPVPHMYLAAVARSLAALAANRVV